MKPEDVDLSAVNWEHGMLLTPEHFVRFERYLDSSLLWMLRYVTNTHGLIGGGPRLPEHERGAVRHDPIVVVEEDEQAVNVAVTQCRGLTPGGCMIDIDPEHPVRRSFSKSELEGVAEAGVYILCQPHTKETADGPLDDFNPQMRTERRLSYRLSLQLPPDLTPYAMVVARIRRPRDGAGYEQDSDYIPACTSMLACSQLAARWREIVEEVSRLAERYTELYRAMQEFLKIFKERGIETELDVETANFVGRMVVALQNCAWEILDPVQPPQAFFGHLRRFFHSAAVYLDLSPPTQQYFEQLKETGETEFIRLLGQQKRALQTTRKWELNDDLAIEVRAGLASLGALARLEQALEGKYVDFRVSPSLEAMNFIFDRGGQVLYKLAAKPSRVQGFADELTVTFSQLRLEGRDKYRLILTGEAGANFERGDKIIAEVRLNEGSGFRRDPIILPSEVKLAGQRNFEFDFEAPDVPTITDVRVSLQAHYPIRTALLFVRHRFYAGRTEEGARPVERASPEPVRPPRPFAERLSPVEPKRGVPPSSDRPADSPRRGEAPRGPETPPPPRRRRLE